jgi:hypothetical protein
MRLCDDDVDLTDETVDSTLLVGVDVAFDDRFARVVTADADEDVLELRGKLSIDDCDDAAM